VSRATDGRDVLIAELLGDFQKLLDRIDAVTPRLVEVQQRFESTASGLHSSVDLFRTRIITMACETQDKAVAHIAQQASLIARRTVAEQTAALKESARTIFAEEVTPPLRQLACELQQSARDARRWWLVCLTYAAAAIACAVCSILLLALYLEHRGAASAKPIASVEPLAPAPPASRPETARARR